METSPGGRHWNAGNSNDLVKYGDDILELDYFAGDVCKHSNEFRSTRLSFVCGAKGSGSGIPEFVSEGLDDCTYHVYWHTELACQNQVCVLDIYVTYFQLHNLKDEKRILLHNFTVVGGQNIKIIILEQNSFYGICTVVPYLKQKVAILDRWCLMRGLQ